VWQNWSIPRTYYVRTKHSRSFVWIHDHHTAVRCVKLRIAGTNEVHICGSIVDAKANVQEPSRLYIEYIYAKVVFPDSQLEWNLHKDPVTH